MAEPAPATENNEARRIEMLDAAAGLICERGFGDTRIADVAKRAGVSSALVIYYFGTRDRLLVDALRHSEVSFYAAAEKMLAEVTSLRERLSLLIKWTVIPQADNEIPGAWGLWLDLWAQAFRHEEVKAGRVELDARWRGMIVDAIRSGEATDELERRRRRADVRTRVRRAARRPLDPGGARGPGGRLRAWPTTSPCGSPSESSTCHRPRNRGRPVRPPPGSGRRRAERLLRDGVLHHRCRSSGAARGPRRARRRT